MTALSHLDANGDARMVDVSAKSPGLRRAVATGHILMNADSFALLHDGAPKGDVLATARIAAIQAAKQTANLIPLCHPLGLTHVAATFHADPASAALHLTVTTEALDRTGVEMEALCAVSVGLLTVYDMLKAVDRGMRIDGIHLLEKHGGRSGSWHADPHNPAS